MIQQPDTHITSSRNRWIRLARFLQRRRQRYKERAILVEGVRPIQEAMSAGIEFRAVLLDASLDQNTPPAVLAHTLAEQQTLVLTVERELFRLAADTENPQGIVAICEMPGHPDLTRLPEKPLILIVDAVRDPGNLGSLLRSALGAGVDLALIAPESADPWSPKVVRAGAGSHFRLPISFMDWDDLPTMLSGCVILAADATGETPYDEVDWTQASALIISNETQGLSEGAKQRAHGAVGIPLANSLESLNAGVAGSVILFEASRQRRRSS